MACVCSLCNACADWPIVVHSSIMPAGCKTKVKSHIINNLLTSNIWSLRKILTRPCHIDLTVA